MYHSQPVFYSSQKCMDMSRKSLVPKQLSTSYHMVMSLLAACLVLGSWAKTASEGYDLQHPRTIDVPKQVDQISGIACATGDAVYAIDDDHGDLYKISLGKKTGVQKWKFGAKADYEDVVLVKDRFYILNSDGTIVSFAQHFPIMDPQQFKLPLKGKNEFEALYYDPASQKLVLLCKNCHGDDKDEMVAWSFDPLTQTFRDKPFYTVKVKGIEKLLGRDVGEWKPSAAAINPLTGDLYVLSSVNKLLVVLDPSRNVKQVFPLDAHTFKQPEGITFTPEGDMLISNESAHQGSATILVFKKQ